MRRKPIVVAVDDRCLFLEKRLVFPAFPGKNRPEPTVTVGPVGGPPCAVAIALAIVVVIVDRERSLGDRLPAVDGRFGQ